ncbi:MAG TPA: VOC family protein [Gemmatimonadota bacterium]|nr:VOC family protein [Gemmatimonadota bacterium]
MKPRGLDFVSYSVTDMDRSEAFYRDVLGLDIEVARGEPGTRASGYMEFDAGGTAISLTALPQLHPNAIVALAVEDVGEAVVELRGQGVEIAMDPMETPVCFMAVVADPDGNKILLHQRKDGSFG